MDGSVLPDDKKTDSTRLMYDGPAKQRSTLDPRYFIASLELICNLQCQIIFRVIQFSCQTLQEETVNLTNESMM